MNTILIAIAAAAPLAFTVNTVYLESARVEDLEKRFDAATDPTERERLATLLWQEGDAEMLATLAEFAAARGDRVGAYARLYLLDEYAKFNARRQPPDPKVRGPFFATIHRRLAELGSRLTPAERAAGETLARRLLHDNAANCCLPM